jgi:hypothetical protein
VVQRSARGVGPLGYDGDASVPPSPPEDDDTKLDAAAYVAKWSAQLGVAVADALASMPHDLLSPYTKWLDDVAFVTTATRPFRDAGGNLWSVLTRSLAPATPSAAIDRGRDANPNKYKKDDEPAKTRALSALRGALSALRGATFSVAVASALFALGDPAGRDTLLDVLAHASAWQERKQAAAALAPFPGDDVEAALLAALRDDDRTVRLNALDALLARHEIESRSYLDAVGMWKVRIGSSIAAIRDAAIADLDLAHPPSYEAPEQAPWCAALIDSFGDELAIDGVRALTGDDRRWAEDVILSRLPGDMHAVRALAALGVTRAIPALRELPPGDDVRAALAALGDHNR